MAMIGMDTVSIMSNEWMWRVALYPFIFEIYTSMKIKLYKDIGNVEECAAAVEKHRVIPLKSYPTATSPKIGKCNCGLNITVSNLKICCFV